MEKIYSSLTAHLEALLIADNSNLVNYEIVSLGNPQSTGIIKCFESENGIITITYKLFRIVNDTYVSELITNYV